MHLVTISGNGGIGCGSDQVLVKRMDQDFILQKTLDHLIRLVVVVVTPVTVTAVTVLSVGKCNYTALMMIVNCS